MNSAETQQDVADFIEYCYGDASKTIWGAQRAADGHAGTIMLLILLVISHDQWYSTLPAVLG
jgi:alpha-L-arabinofuranosidase